MFLGLAGNGWALEGRTDLQHGRRVEARPLAKHARCSAGTLPPGVKGVKGARRISVHSAPVIAVQTAILHRFGQVFG